MSDSPARPGQQFAASMPAVALEPKARSCAQAYALCVASLLLVVLIGGPLQLWFLPIGLAVTEFMILLAAILFVRAKCLGIADALVLRPVPAGVIVRAVFLGITAWGVAGALYLLISRPVFGNAPAYDAMAAHSVSQLMVTLLVAAVLPGICEEALFRGAIFGVLQRKTPAKAVLISAALFAVYHLNPWNLVPVFFLGILLGVLRVQTGSLYPCMIAHTSINATAFIASYLTQDKAREAFALLPVIVLSLLFIAVAVEFIRRAPKLPGAISPLASVPAAISWWVSLLVPLAPIVFIAGVRLCVRGFPAMEDQPSLGILKGDLVLTARAATLPLPIHPGDRIVLLENQHRAIRQVTRLDETQIWIAHGNPDGTTAETSVPRRALIGKVLYTIPASQLPQSPR
jgi:membrane protease YdiL (CAAX protease family)